MHGGAAAWLTGSYDPELNLLYWGTGNPGPDFYREQRPGDNLYSDSVVALDADTGELRWYFQFTPADPYDYDAVQIPVLADIERNDTEFKVMLWANRNGFYYVLDRATGRFLTGLPFIDVNWAEGLDDSGRPVETPQPPGEPTFPRRAGRHQLVLARFQPEHRAVLHPRLGGLRLGLRGGRRRSTGRAESFIGGRPTTYEPVPDAPTPPGLTRGADQRLDGGGGPRRGDRARRAVRCAALEVRDDRRHQQRDPDDRLGRAVHGSPVGATSRRCTRRRASCCGRPASAGQVVNGPMTYEVDGRQYVAVISGHSLSAFAPGARSPRSR